MTSVIIYMLEDHKRVCFMQRFKYSVGTGGKRRWKMNGLVEPDLMCPST